MQSDTAETVVAVTARVLIVDGDADSRARLGNTLVAGGFEVRVLPDAAVLQRTLADWRPHVIVIGERLPASSGRELALKLRSQGAYFDIPLVGLLADESVPQALLWLRSGATDLWKRDGDYHAADRVTALLDELNETRVHTGAIKPRLLAFARRHELNGTVLVYPDTPFEGRARFDRGTLASVRLSGDEGEAALDELLMLDDAPSRWVPGDEITGRLKVPGGAYRAQVLVVEDDDALRGLLLKQLAVFGEVDDAADGIEGLLKATQHSYDVIVADLNLPGLDGWGLLRQLKQHVRAREAAVLVLSAHDELRETLKAARAGARAYLKKTGRAKPLLDTLELLLAPRQAAWASLARNDRTPLDLRLVGPMWALRTIAELDLVGALQLADPLGTYEVQVAHGQLLSATAQTGSLRVEGAMALESILASQGEGEFVPGALGVVPTQAPWLYDTADGAGKALEDWLSARMRDAVSQPSKLYLHPELSQLYARVASERELKVLAALRSQLRSVEELSRAVGLTYEDVELSLSELFRRGVLSTEPPPNDSSESGVLDPKQLQTLLSNAES